MDFLKAALIQKMVDIGIAKERPCPFGIELPRKIQIFVPDIEAETFVAFEAAIRTLFKEYQFASISVSGEIEGGGQKNAMIEIMRRDNPDKKSAIDPYRLPKDPYEMPKDERESPKPHSIF